MRSIPKSKDPVMKRTVFVLSVLCSFCLAACGKREGKVELNRIPDNTRQSQETVLPGAGEKLTPELFFRISIEVNRISRKYAPLDAGRGAAATNGSAMEKKISAVYRNYNVTEEIFNAYSESHFRELENFLSRHPEIEGQLHP